MNLDLIGVFLGHDPRLNIGSPLITVVIRNIEDTSSGDSSWSGVGEISDLEDHLHVRFKHNTLVGS